MSSPIIEALGIDIAWVFVAIFVVIIVLTVLLIMEMERSKKLKKRLNKLTRGKEGKSLEQDILSLFEDNKYIKEENEKIRKENKEIIRKLDYCFQKIGLIKYDAFNQMGGKLSFCLCLLNDKNDGFILNSVHSSDGCYVYTKEIKKGESELPLGDEEAVALKEAIGF